MRLGFAKQPLEFEDLVRPGNGCRAEASAAAGKKAIAA